MMTRELAPADVTGNTWLGLTDLPANDPDADTEPDERPDMARGAGAQVTPAAALMQPTGVGMDPTDPGTWTRPYNPQEGMFTRLHREAGVR